MRFNDLLDVELEAARRGHSDAALEAAIAGLHEAEAEAAELSEMLNEELDLLSKVDQPTWARLNSLLKEMRALQKLLVP